MILSSVKKLCSNYNMWIEKKKKNQKEFECLIERQAFDHLEKEIKWLVKLSLTDWIELIELNKPSELKAKWIKTQNDQIEMYDFKNKHVTKNKKLCFFFTYKFISSTICSNLHFFFRKTFTFFSRYKQCKHW